MRESLAAVALALLLATAGCSVLGGGNGGTSLSAEERPPGVAENGTLVDESALLDANTETGVAAGGVWEIRTNATVVQRGQVGRVARHQQTYVEPDATEYGYALENPATSFQAWGNQSVQVIKANLGGRTRYRVAGPATNAELAGRPVLARQVHEGALNVTAVNRSGDTTLVTLETTEPPTDSGAFPDNATDIRDYRATLVVDSSGRVHRFEATATYTIDGEEGSSAFVYELLQADPPSVQRPEWVREALRQSDSG